MVSVELSDGTFLSTSIVSTVLRCMCYAPGEGVCVMMVRGGAAGGDVEGGGDADGGWQWSGGRI